MLSLSRKVGERFFINDDIILTIVKIKGNIVTVSFDAPKEVKIYREEIYKDIKAEEKANAIMKYQELP